MPERQGHMGLTMFMITAGYHYDAWRRPGSRMEEWGRLGLLVDMIQKAEAAKLDAMFFGDLVGAGPVPGTDPTQSGHYESISSIGALIGYTSRIGMIGTASTTFLPPYTVARQFSGLDSLSGGRVGWNVVTSSMGETNYGLDAMPSGEERYRMAAEFLDVCFGLWDGWSDEAALNDREGGRWCDPKRIIPLNHKGEFFSVEGPINMPRSPQGRPIIVQAGSSDAGQSVGAKYADAIYTQQPIKEDSIAFYRGFKDKVRGFGRDPKDVRIMPGIVPILGRTEAEARELEAELASYVNLENGRRFVGRRLEMDLSDFPIDDVIPESWFVGPKFESISRYNVFKNLAVNERCTLRQLIQVNARSHGHGTITGTPSQVADRMIDWYESRACDGFNLNSPFIPGGQDLILDLLVPELVERGYFRSEYTGETLRDHWDLPRPPAWDKQ